MSERRKSTRTTEEEIAQLGADARVETLSQGEVEGQDDDRGTWLIECAWCGAPNRVRTCSDRHAYAVCDSCKRPFRVC